MPKPSFDFNNLIDTAPALLSDHDIIEMVHGSAEARDSYAENFAHNLVERLPVDEKTKDRIFSEVIMTIGYAMNDAYEAVFHPHVEETSLKSVPRIVLEKTETEIRRNWIHVLEGVKDYAAATAWQATSRNASPDPRIS